MPRGRAGPYDVAIVGFGPTGATLANLLGLCGLRVALLERERGIPRLPRAVHFDGEVMRIFQAIGVADRVAAVSRVNAGMRFVDPAGRLLLDWPRPQQVGPQGWHPSYRFHQPDLETILRYRLSSVPNVDVVLGADVTAIAQDAELGSITYREGDRQHTLTARYVVGCDGARSLVRTHITSRAEDLGFHERWLVVDLLLHGDRPDLGDFTIQYCHPETPMTYVRGPGLRRRWEIFIADLPDAQALAPANIWQRLARWLTPADAEVERAAVYTFHSVIASSWRRGRLLIAGDAAHQTPPFMGVGSGGLSDDRAGYGSAILAQSFLLAGWDGRALAENKGIHVWNPGDLDGTAEYLAELGAPAVAIRPDRYVYGTANDAATLDTLVDDLPPSPVRI